VPAPTPLSRDRILRAAFDHADEHGLDAVTMRSVAGRLGVEAMSLYHHVPNKKAILDGLVDLLIQVAELPTGQVTPEQWIRGAGQGLRALGRQHPRLVPLLGTRSVPLFDPRAAEPFEAGLAAFTRAGAELGRAYAALQTVLVSLLAMTQLEAVAALESAPPEASGVGQLDAERFPLLHGIDDDAAGLDDFWRTLVETLVRGLDNGLTA
jgi:AcrR family transcriptional regulator